MIPQLMQWAALNEEARSAALKRPSMNVPGMDESVSDIIKQVREGGDGAILSLTEKFDGCRPETSKVSQSDLEMALTQAESRLVDAIKDASQRIRLFHQADIPDEISVETAPGLTCTASYRALGRVGIYVPAGSAPLISTVMMLAIPATLAGWKEIIMCSPPGSDGKVAAEILATAKLCGVDQVFSIGGAQAIAAMAYGTESVPACHKIFGPGNAWVTAAKQQVSQDPAGAAIDMPAGPSEVLVIADHAAASGDGIDFICWDLLSQAEHGPDSQVILLTDSVKLADAVMERLAILGPASPRKEILQKSLSSARVIVVEDIRQAIEISNDYAPEHLILNTCDARELVSQVEHAGSVFIGRWTPESLGDYCSGTNHVLPTYGFASSHGALGVSDFMRRMTIQEASADALLRVGPTAEVLADIEQLDAHRMAVVSRLTSLQSS
jgi:histidinol dehydrogenase